MYWRIVKIIFFLFKIKILYYIYLFIYIYFYLFYKFIFINLINKKFKNRTFGGQNTNETMESLKFSCFGDKIGGISNLGNLYIWKISK